MLPEPERHRYKPFIDSRDPSWDPGYSPQYDIELKGLQEGVTSRFTFTKKGLQLAKETVEIESRKTRLNLSLGTALYRLGWVTESVAAGYNDIFSIKPGATETTQLFSTFLQFAEDRNEATKNWIKRYLKARQRDLVLDDEYSVGIPPIAADIILNIEGKTGVEDFSIIIDQAISLSHAISTEMAAGKIIGAYNPATNTGITLPNIISSTPFSEDQKLEAIMQAEKVSKTLQLTPVV
ncbi:MAG TPA: hypothetical protein VG965_02895 [Patescibacteria group bacterium]|nr:hypothetical protein [Patescibacteria group bacterium]